MAYRVYSGAGKSCAIHQDFMQNLATKHGKKPDECAKHRAGSAVVVCLGLGC